MPYAFKVGSGGSLPACTAAAATPAVTGTVTPTTPTSTTVPTATGTGTATPTTPTATAISETAKSLWFRTSCRQDRRRRSLWTDRAIRQAKPSRSVTSRHSSGADRPQSRRRPPHSQTVLLSRADSHCLLISNRCRTLSPLLRSLLVVPRRPFLQCKTHLVSPTTTATSTPVLPPHQRQPLV